MHSSSSIFVAGHKGLVGSAIVRALRAKGYDNLILRSRSELNLLDQQAVANFFQSQKIDHVVVAAARVGGIIANSTYPADFLYENLMIAANIVHAAATNNVDKLLFLGSSCIYPKFAEQPICEESLLSGPLEPTNEGYAIAKIAGLKLCELYFRQYGKNFISAMPTNLYGPGDNFDANNSHVIPGMMRRFHEAKERNLDEVVLWGTGAALRDFLFVDDLADALVLLMESYNEPEFVNVGSGTEVSIAQLADMMKEVVGFQGRIRFDSSYPDGTPRKIVDIRRISKLGWSPKIDLKEGLERTYAWATQTGSFAGEITAGVER